MERKAQHNNRFMAFANMDRAGHSGQRVTVSRSQLKGVMKSKLDIYNILTKEGQMYMPPVNECTMEFIKEVLMGKKKVSYLS